MVLRFSDMKSPVVLEVVIVGLMGEDVRMAIHELPTLWWDFSIPCTAAIYQRSKRLRW